MSRRLGLALGVLLAGCSARPQPDADAGDVGDPRDAGDPVDAGFLGACDARHHDQDEVRPNECPADAEELVPFEPVVRSIAFSGDEDWYRFTFPPGSETADFSEQFGNVERRFFDEHGVDLGGPQLMDVREGPVYCRVSALPGHAGREEYWASFEAYKSDDYPNVAARAVDIPATGASGEINSWVDQDWMRLPVRPGRKYALHFSFGNMWPPGVSFGLAVGNDAPSTLDVANFEPTGVGRFATVVAQGDSLVLGVKWQRPWSVDLGTWWDLRVEELGGGTIDDFPDEPSQARAEAVNGRMSGTLETAADVDWFVVPPQDPSHFYGFDLMGSDVYASLWELNGDLVTTPGVVYQGQPRERRVRVAGGLAIPAGAWTVQMSDLGVFVDVSGDRTAATPVTVGTPYRGLFEVPNDPDAYAFTVTQNHFYEVSVVAADAGVTQLDLFDTFDRPIGAFLFDRHQFRADRTGPNAAVLTWRSSKAFVPYRLDVTDLGADELDLVPMTIPAGGAPLTAGLQASFDTDRFVLAASDPLSVVHLDAPQPIFVTEVLTNGRRLLHHPDAGADFGVRAQGFDHLELAPAAGSTFPVTYTLTANPAPQPDDYDDLTPTPIPLDTAVYGRLDSFDDVDLLSFDLTATGPFRVHIAPTCAFVDLVQPLYGTVPIFDGHLYAYTVGTYRLRIHTERCGLGTWGVTVTQP
ncbi:MAG: hypothetical protein U0228_14040 [Myxococcaceae bacterium]